MKLIVSVVFWADGILTSHLEHRRSNTCTYCKRRGSSSCRQRRVAKIHSFAARRLCRPKKYVQRLFSCLCHQFCVQCQKNGSFQGPNFGPIFGGKTLGRWKGLLSQAVAESKAASHAAAGMTKGRWGVFLFLFFFSFSDFSFSGKIILWDLWGCFWYCTVVLCRFL